MFNPNNGPELDVVLKPIVKGEIYYCDLDKENGPNCPSSRYIKTRPMMIVSTEEWNSRFPPMAIPLTSSESEYIADFPEVNIQKGVVSKIVVRAMQPVSIQNIVQGNTILKQSKIDEVDDTLIEMLGLKDRLNYSDDLARSSIEEVQKYKKEVEELKDIIAELKSTLKLREKQLKQFSVPVVEKNTKEKTNTNKVKSNETTNKTKEKRTRNNNTLSPAKVKEWDAARCREFLEFADDSTLTIDAITNLYNIGSYRSYHNIVKICRETVKK